MPRKHRESNSVMLANFALTTMKVMLVIGFLCMLMMAVDQSKKKYETEGIKLPIIAMVIITWPNEMDVDIDLHARCPTGDRINFAVRTGCFATLERDARGSSTDSINLNGSRVVSIDNREIIAFRKPVQGEWIINVQWYSTKVYTGPVPVLIELSQVNPESKMIASRTVMLESIGDEKHVLRFEMGPDGLVGNVSTDLPVGIVPGARFRYD